jgi:hypothetical protein
VIGNNGRIKAIYGTGKISGWQYYQQSKWSHQDFEVNVQNKKRKFFGYQHLAETGDWQRALPTNRCIDITERKKATEDLEKSKQSANDSNATLRKSELSLVKSNDTFLNYLIITAEYQYVRKKVVNILM